MERKEFAGIEIKDAVTGAVAARVATLAVCDRDRDWIEPTAVHAAGVPVLMSSYGHNVITDNREPVGHGILRPVDGMLRFDGRLFLKTQRGRETHALLTELPRELGQWSFGYEVVKAASPSRAQEALGVQRVLASILPVEVSPVFRGSGVSTATLSVKQAPHLPAEETELRRIHAKVDPRQQGQALPDRFRDVARFAAESFAIPGSQRPPVRLVERWRIRDASDGCYDVKADTILIASDLADEDVAATLFHEMTHVYEARQRTPWTPDEDFARNMERQLLNRWHAVRQPAYLSL